MPEQDYITHTELSGVLIIERPTFTDDRGFFRETFRKEDIETRLGSNLEFMQANHSRSVQDTLRGIHIAPWHKLVTCTGGRVQQIVVDTRAESPTFGKHISIIIGEENWKSVFVPAGCGNAFLVLTDTADYTYLATDYWTPGKEQYLRYNDADLAISWQIPTPHVSQKDSTNPTLKESYPNKF